MTDLPIARISALRKQAPVLTTHASALWRRNAEQEITTAAHTGTVDSCFPGTFE